ncbi:MAG: alkaline phosphatase family protein, partial [Candidatus Nanohaloarchaea archaeon]
MGDRKTFIFAIHAMSYHRMKEKVEEGLMPNFRKLMDEGSYGISKSVFSTASAVDYTSMLTGSTHDTHGIEHFQTNTMEGFYFAHYPRDGRLESVPPKFWDKTRQYTQYDVQVPWVWQLLEDQRSIQMGVFSPTTYPAPELPNDGIWVSGYWAKNNSTLLKDHVPGANDQEIREQLLDLYPDYQLTPFYTQPPLYPKGVDNQKDYHDRKLENALKHSTGMQKARFEIFKQEDWDIFLTEDGFCDLMQHVSWPRSEDNP